MKHTYLCAVAGAVLLASGCGGDNLSVDTVDALGSVGGVVLDAETRAPLQGVSVDLLAGGVYFEPVVTEADGRYAFTDVPAGEVLVTMTGPAGYQQARIRDEIPSNAGEFATGNAAVTIGPIGLIPASQTFSVRVLDQEGSPVSQYEVWMRTFSQYVDYTSGRGVSAGETLAMTTTDVDGYARFESVPDFFRLGPDADDSLEFLLPPLDKDGNGTYEFSGGEQVFRMRALADPTPDIVLDAGLEAALELETSTIEALFDPAAPATVLDINGAIFAKFNLPLDGIPVVNISDEDGQLLSSAPEITVQDDSLSIDFAAQPLTAGQEYNVHIRATTSIGGRVLESEVAAPFFTRGSAQITAEATSLAGGDIEITFSEPIGAAGGAAITLASPDCVLFLDADLDASATTGDAASELGSDACNITLGSAEPDPDGPVGLSGYTRYWRFSPPLVNDAPLPAATPIHVLFTRLVDVRVERPDGSPLPDIVIDGFDDGSAPAAR